jgi:hypothetical protein
MLDYVEFQKSNSYKKFLFLTSVSFTMKKEMKFIINIVIFGKITNSMITGHFFFYIYPIRFLHNLTFVINLWNSNIWIAMVFMLGRIYQVQSLDLLFEAFNWGQWTLRLTNQLFIWIVYTFFVTSCITCLNDNKIDWLIDIFDWFV